MDLYIVYLIYDEIIFTGETSTEVNTVPTDDPSASTSTDGEVQKSLVQTKQSPDEDLWALNQLKAIGEVHSKHLSAEHRAKSPHAAAGASPQVTSVDLATPQTGPKESSTVLVNGQPSEDYKNDFSDEDDGAQDDEIIDIESERMDIILGSTITNTGKSGYST